MLKPSLRFSLAALALSVAAPLFALVPSENAATDPSTTAAPAGTAGPSGYDPPIQPASEEAERAISKFRMPEGMKASLVAAEPDVANPVAFSIDEQGRYWVCETFRQGNAVVDNRGRDYWLLDDLAAQAVEDRLAYYKKHLGEEGLKAFSEHQDRIRLLTDKDGDGVVDESTVFADGFNAPESGTGAGVLKVGDDVFYTNIPDLWRLRDTNGDGVADEQESLATGFGVRVAFRGHDMHGLIMGPDGRLYFSIGDRGFNVTTKEGKHLVMPDRGAVFRCETDGSNLEVFASGLRNPQELAFDDYGNLFTGDNNSDSGDKARWVYVAEGSDSGWRMYYQYLDDRGPWNREMMWYPHDAPPLEDEGPGGVPKGTLAKDVQPAYILPPVINLGDGPSGLTHYPGVGLSDRYKDHFFLCDFRGTPNNSGVRSFAVKPKGAGFELVDSHEFIWSILATDNAFTPDGRFVVSDWVDGWNGEGKGRLYAFTDPEHAKAGAESAELLAEDFSKRTPEQLIELFGHRDRRVRQKAQFELAERPFKTWPGMAIDRLIQSNRPQPLLHLVWALSQHARNTGDSGLVTLATHFDSAPAVVRAQMIKGIGDFFERGVENGITRTNKPNAREKALSSAGYTAAALRIATGLNDEDAGVRLQALIAIPKADWRTEIGSHLSKILETKEEQLLKKVALLLNPQNAVFGVLESSGDDAALRSAAHTALANIGDVNALTEAKKHSSAAVRTSAVVALRRRNSEKVANFLADSDSSVITEAARAINDVPIDAATAQLAALAGKSDLNDPTLRRVLNANFRLGNKSNAEAIAKVAANAETPAALRVEAVSELKLWADPPKTDRVTGMYRPIESRDASFVADVVRPMLSELLSAKESDVRRAAIELATAYKIGEVAPTLQKIAADAKRDDRERVAALKGLAAIDAKGLDEIFAKAVQDESAAVRSEARSLWASHDPEAAVPVLDETVKNGETIEKQAAIATLADLKTDAADAILGKWLDQLAKGTVPGDIQLDLLEAAEKRDSLKSKTATVESARSDGDALAAWRVSLTGGDAEKGKDIFFNRASVSCQRCHKAENGRGGEVGPDLSKIAEKKDRTYLLESIVTPNSKIAENFESVVVIQMDGQVVTGVKRAEDDKSLTIITAEGKGIVISKDEIEDRAVGKSAMPEDLIKHLSKRDVRDLVEYLASQK